MRHERDDGICQPEGGSDLNNWLYTLLFLAVLGVIIYLSYRRGYMISKSIVAAVFVSSPGSAADRATLNSCSGWVQHMGRFCKSGMYDFTFDAQLSKGDVEVLLLDRNKRQLARLNRGLPAYRIELDAKSRYYIRWEFRSASGTCELRW